MSNNTAFAPGTHVTVVSAYGQGPGVLKPGRRLVVTSTRKTLSAGYQVRVATPEEFAGPDPVIEQREEYGSDWFERAEGIPFSLTKDTSKAYALKQVSRALSETHNDVLLSAGNGEEVDVWDFHLAVTAALSLAATRDGQSMGRRNWTKECRHLLYISGAVIANSLAGLPPVEPGTRSPKIARLEADLANAVEGVKYQQREYEEHTSSLKAERDSYAQQLGAERQHSTGLEARVSDLIREKTDLELLAARQHALLSYAKGFLDLEENAALDGFGAGYDYGS